MKTSAQGSTSTPLNTVLKDPPAGRRNMSVGRRMSLDR